MIAEALNPPPSPDAPVPVVPEGNTDADVRARFRQAMEQSKPEPEPEVKPEPVKEKVQDGKLDIPDEFFGESKPEEDEFDRMMKEEVKGQIKNENYKRFKEATSAKVSKLMKELEETRSKIPKDDYVPEKTAKQLEALQKSLQEREELISRKYIEETPEFRERFIQRKETVTKQLSKLGKELGVQEDVISQLVHSSPKRQIEILDGLDITANGSSRLNTLLEQYDQISSEQQVYLSDWKGRAEEQEAKALAYEDKEKARIKGLYDKAFEDVLSDVTKNNALFQKKEGNDAWNNQTQELIEEARQYFNAENSTPHKDAEMFLAGVAARRATAMMEKAVSLYRETKKELDDLKAAGPGGGHGADTEVADPTKNMTADQRAAWSYRDAVAKAANGGFAR
jgi:hypothetical protein